MGKHLLKRIAVSLGVVCVVAVTKVQADTMVQKDQTMLLDNPYFMLPLNTRDHALKVRIVKRYDILWIFLCMH